jgi:hypothetical protein
VPPFALRYARFAKPNKKGSGTPTDAGLLCRAAGTAAAPSLPSPASGLLYSHILPNHREADSVGSPMICGSNR